MKDGEDLKKLKIGQKKLLQIKINKINNLKKKTIINNQDSNKLNKL